MIIDTSSIKDGSAVITGLTALDDFKDSLPPMRSKVKCTATINRVQLSLYIQLHFSGVFALQCARCLNEYDCEVSVDSRLILEERAGCHGPADDEEIADYYFNEEYAQVDISAHIFDEIVTSFPLMPLCSESCSGIENPAASKKGNNGNVECDPRWDALKKLRDREK